MNKLISKKIQLLITCIPYVSCFMLFIWLYNCYRSPNSSRIFPKSLLVIFLHSIPLVMIQIFLTTLLGDSLPIISSIIDTIMFYLIPFSIGIGLINYQTKLGLDI